MCCCCKFFKCSLLLGSAKAVCPLLNGSLYDDTNEKLWKRSSLTLGKALNGFLLCDAFTWGQQLPVFHYIFSKTTFSMRYCLEKKIRDKKKVFSIVKNGLCCTRMFLYFPLHRNAYLFWNNIVTKTDHVYLSYVLYCKLNENEKIFFKVPLSCPIYDQQMG